MVRKGKLLITFLCSVISLLLLSISSVGATARIAHKPSFCYKNVELDIYFLQDSTGSFQSQITAFRTFLPEFLKLIIKKYPGSRFAYGVFGDKPRNPRSLDKCYVHVAE